MHLSSGSDSLLSLSHCTIWYFLSTLHLRSFKMWWPEMDITINPRRAWWLASMTSICWAFTSIVMKCFKRLVRLKIHSCLTNYVALCSICLPPQQVNSRCFLTDMSQIYHQVELVRSLLLNDKYSNWTVSLQQSSCWDCISSENLQEENR